MLIDRATSRVTFMASTEGGMDIEEVAESTPEKIITIDIDPATGFCRLITPVRSPSRLGLEGKQVNKAVKFADGNVQGVHEPKMSLGRDQPAGRHRRTARSSRSTPR